MQSFIFLDLDDTLFQTLRKCGQYDSGANGFELQPRAYLKNGSPISYATPKQERLWQWFSRSGRIIPVTARNFDAFSRVDLPFTEEVILNHGAVILDKNRHIDQEWQEHMADILPPYQPDLLDLWEQLQYQTRNDPALNPRIIKDFGITLYGVVKHSDANEEVLSTLLNSVIKNHHSVLSGRLYCHFNGNNLAIIPDPIRKATAVRFLMDRYAKLFESIFTVGIGDSKTDIPFMSLCDYAVIPRNTQIGAFFHGS